MALNEVLRLIIEGDNRGAVKAVKGVGDATSKELGKSQKSIDKWGVGLTKAGVGMMALGGAALIGLGKMAKMSEEANLAQVKLDNTLANMPKLAGENSKQFTDLATKIQSVTAADADAIVEGEAMLGTFNLTAKQIKGITPLVVDYARKFGLDIPKAAVMVGKALDGNVGALKKNGVSIDEVMFKTDKYGAVQKALSDQVGGFAKAEGATFAGSLERMKNQLGDLAEGVGGGAVDAFTSMFSVVGKAAGALEKISPGAQHAAGQIATFASVGVIAAGGLSTLIGQAILARKRFGELAGGISALSTKMGGFGNIVKGGAIVAAVFAIDKALEEAFGPVVDVHTANLGKLEAGLLRFSKTGRMSADLIKIVGTDFKALGDAFKTTDLSGMDKARKGLEDLSQKIPIFDRLQGGDFTEGIQQASQDLDDFDKALARIAGTDPAAAFDIVKAAAKEMGVSVKDLMPALDDYDAAIGDASAEAEKGGTKVDSFGRSMEGQADSTDEATDALKEYQDELRATFDPLFALQDAVEGNKDAQADLAAKQLEAIAAQQAYTDAVKKSGPKSKEATEAFFNMAAAQDAVTDASRDVARGVVTLESATAEMRAEIEKNPAAVEQAKRKFREIGAQAGLTKAEIKKTTDSFDRLASSIRKTPGAKRILVSVRGTEDARVKIARVRDAMGQLHDRFLTIGVTAAIGPQAVGIMESKMFQHSARGGPIKAGDLHVVGEEGPELFVSDRAGKIIPHGAFAQTLAKPPKSLAGMAMAGGGGGGGGNGGHVQVDVNIVGEGLMRYLRNQVRVEYGGDVQAALGTKR